MGWTMTFWTFCWGAIFQYPKCSQLNDKKFRLLKMILFSHNIYYIHTIWWYIKYTIILTLARAYYDYAFKHTFWFLTLTFKPICIQSTIVKVRYILHYIFQKSNYRLGISLTACVHIGSHGYSWILMKMLTFASSSKNITTQLIWETIYP